MIPKAIGRRSLAAEQVLQDEVVGGQVGALGAEPLVRHLADDRGQRALHDRVDLPAAKADGGRTRRPAAAEGIMAYMYLPEMVS